MERKCDKHMHDYLKVMSANTGKENRHDLKSMLGDIAVALDQSAIVAITDRTGKITYVNEQFTKISQYSAEELVGSTHKIINSDYHSKNFFKNMWATIGKGQVWKGEIRNQSKDGNYYWVDTKIVPFLDEKGHPYRYIAIRYDITSRKLMEEQIRKDAEVYRLITENSLDFISVIDREGRFQYLSPSHRNLLGYSISALKEESIYSLVSEKNHAVIREALERQAAIEKPIEIVVINKVGQLKTMEATLRLIREKGEYNNHFVLAMHDITSQKHSESMIRDLYDYDQLTSLLNRSSFRQRLKQSLEAAERSSTKVGLVYVNIDRLRHVNDSFGHEAGDQTLSILADRLRTLLNENEVIGRISGDEFAFTLSDAKDENAIEKIAHQIKEHLEEPIVINEKSIVLSISCGIAMYPQHAAQSTDLITKAEKALRFVKDHGGNGYKLYESGMATKNLERILLENELRKSVQMGNFKLEYQPKINLSREALSSVEALVRWDHPDLGRIPPDKFIPLAEETKMILPLGEWILREACKQALQWKKKGCPVRIAVNMSAVQLEEIGIVESIERILKEEFVDTDLIEIELTESAFANRIEMSDTIERIRKLGITVAIDDFGTGYSTLSYIKELPADTLKIDRSFIRDIELNENSRAIVKAIIMLADTAGLNVVAEGIESKEQAEILLELGCREGQGYYYSKPLPPKDCESMMIAIGSCE